MEVVNLNTAFEQCQRLHKKRSCACRGACFWLSVTLILNNVRSCIRTLAVPAVGPSSGVQDLACSGISATGEGTPFPRRRLGAVVTHTLAGVWAGNHLGITMESDRFAPLELLGKEKGKRGLPSPPAR